MPESPEIPPLSAGATIIRLATAIGVRAAELRDVADLTAAELRVLQHSPDAPRMGELVAQLEAPKSTITSVVDRLVARGLVSRSTDGHDRRGQIVRATEQGIEMLAQLDAALASRVEGLVEALSAAQRARLTELLERVPAESDPGA